MQADLGDRRATRWRWLPRRSIATARLDALVNNASAFYPTPVAAATPAQWDELFAANVRAPFLPRAGRGAAPRRAIGGPIVNMVDIYAEQPLPRHSVYCMSKAALAMMTKSLAPRSWRRRCASTASRPARCSGRKPARATRTGRCVLERTPLRRTGTPEDVAATVLWLLRDAPFVTGEIVRVDGGRHLAS